MQTGFIDINSNVTGQFEQFSKAFTFVDLPYAVTNWDMAERLFASDLWKQQAAKFEADCGLVPLPPVGGGGFRLLRRSLCRNGNLSLRAPGRGFHLTLARSASVSARLCSSAASAKVRSRSG